MNATMRRVGWVASRGLAAAALGWLGYAALTWKRYGKAARPRRTDTLLDRYMPIYEIAEQHEVEVAAPPAITYETLRAMDPLDSPLVRAIFRGRELLLGADHATNEGRHGIVDQTLALGWRILVEEPGREIVVGAVTKPWEPNVTFRGLSPDEFSRFDEPDYVKIVWTLGVEGVAPEKSRAWTETRVMTTDAVARRRFRRYWAVFSPGILAIRRAGLHRVRVDAERRFQRERAAIAVLEAITGDAAKSPLTRRETLSAARVSTRQADAPTPARHQPATSAQGRPGGPQ